MFQIGFMSFLVGNSIQRHLQAIIQNSELILCSNRIENKLDLGLILLTAFVYWNCKWSRPNTPEDYLSTKTTHLQKFFFYNLEKAVCYPRASL